MSASHSTPQDYFRLILVTVVGQAFEAAGFTLEVNELQQAAGLFRFRREGESGPPGLIEFQLLAATDTPYAPPTASRFNVTLGREPDQRRKLAAVMVQDYGVALLSGPDHWWPYRSTAELGQALAEAGHLVVGFGLPWLNGEGPG